MFHVFVSMCVAMRTYSFGNKYCLNYKTSQMFELGIMNLMATAASMYNVELIFAMFCIDFRCLLTRQLNV